MNILVALKTKQRKKLPVLFSALAVLVAIILATWNIWLPFSYWQDEVYSVIISSAPINEMFSEYIFKDVHPPLYQLLLSFWIYLFGEGEFATRSLSCLFSLGSLLVFTNFCYKKLPIKWSAAAIIFFASNYLVSFYAKETRSYAMMLFLATLLTVMSLSFLTKIREKKISGSSIFSLLGVALLLSLTHYFGLLYSGLVIAYFIFFTGCSKDTKIIFFLLGLVLIAWPIIHFIFGNLESIVGGDFWIETRGFSAFFRAIYAFSLLLSTTISYIINLKEITVDTIYLPIVLLPGVFYFLLRYLLILYRQVKKRKHFGSKLRMLLPSNDYTKFIVIQLASFILFVFIIDLHTPVSTIRNYIVLLPLVALFFAEVIKPLAKIKFHYGLFVGIIFITGNLFAYDAAVLNKQQKTIQDLKAVAQFIVHNNLLETRNFYFQKWWIGDKLSDQLARYYIEKISDKKFTVTLMTWEDFTADIPKEPFIYYNVDQIVDLSTVEHLASNAGFDVFKGAEPQNVGSQNKYIFVLYTTE